MPNPAISIKSLTFSDGTIVPLSAGEIIILVGPNNSGKSASLRAIKEKLKNRILTTVAISDIAFERTGDPGELISHLQQLCRRSEDHSGIPSYGGFGINVRHDNAIHHWTNKDGLGEILPVFCKLLTAEERITTANSPGRIDLTREAVHHPIHSLERNDKLEMMLSNYFRDAFGVDLILHRNAGKALPLMVGKRPVPNQGHDRLSYDFVQELEKLPRLDSQGDGMRSFAGLLLHTFLGAESVVLVDEPEAFLHPPQARLLGRMLSRETTHTWQTIVATHSTDILIYSGRR